MRVNGGNHDSELCTVNSAFIEQGNCHTDTAAHGHPAAEQNHGGFAWQTEDGHNRSEACTDEVKAPEMFSILMITKAIKTLGIVECVAMFQP